MEVCGPSNFMDMRSKSYLNLRVIVAVNRNGDCLGERTFTPNNGNQFC